MQHWTHLLFLEIITLLQTTDEWSVLESSQLIPCRIHCFPGLAFTINFTNKISSPMPLHASSRHWDVTTRNIIIYLGSASDWKIVNIGLTPKKLLFLQILAWRDYIWRHKMDWRRLLRHFFWIYFSISCLFNDFSLVDKKCRAKFCILDDISRRIGLVNVVQLW